MNQIGIRVAFAFGEYMFDQILKQDKSHVVKLPIDFPYLTTGVLMKQKSDILIAEEVLVFPPVLWIFTIGCLLGIMS